MYTVLMDETRSSTGDLFVYAGVILRTRDLDDVQAELQAVAKRFTGSDREELKYSPDAGSAQEEFCRKHGIKSGDAKQAVLDVILKRGLRDATLMAGIVLDPRGTRSRVRVPDIYSWSFDALLQRYAQFLSDRLDRTTAPRNEVIIDTPSADPSLFHRLHSDAWHDGWSWLPWPPPTLKDSAGRPKLLISMARYAPALWLPDHVAGAISDWVRMEREVDLAEAAKASPPKAAAVAAARSRAKPLLERMRKPVVSRGLVAWPEDFLDKKTLRKWAARTV